MFSEELRKLRIEAGYSQEELGKKLGLTKSTISMYELGERKPNLEIFEAIADIFNVSMDMLTGSNAIKKAKNIIPLNKIKKIPVLGRIACGEPILAEENISTYIVLPERINADFALECKGDSMVGVNICDGDVVYIKSQPMVDNGEIAAVLIEDEATLKKVYLTENTLTLISANDSVPPFVYKDEELNTIQILGKAVAVLHQM